ncbi:CAD99-like protein [Mya arenaria]|uniref:CAD99-like protein n=1 Tax=Mya arenaria TaxID=6604 RepID=A0ABY7F3A8_MYAAR|nr:cadherin-99C-like [Mya arenaria]WAR13826.1 CAD99-like protein [Mya arenaria]
MRFLGYLLLVASWTFVSGDVFLFDCSEDTTGAELEIREVDPVGTVVARVSGSDGVLQWSAILGGSRSTYLTQFFTSPKFSTMTTPENAAASLTIARKVDLELLEYEIPNFWEYSRSNGDLTFDLEITCIAEDTPRRHNVHVAVLAVNEFYPQFLRAPYQMAVSEAVEPGAELFSLTSLVTDMDAGDSNFTFAIKPYMISQFDGSRYVTISESGDVTLLEPLDFELLPVGRNYMFVNVTVTDDGGLLTSTSINLTVLDANDQGVELVYPGCPQPCLEANYSADVNVSYIGEVSLLPVPLTAMDLDALNESVIYTLDTDEAANFFRMDERTGRLYKTAVLENDTLGPRFVLNVRVEEASESSHFLLTTVTILVPERLAAASMCTRLY